VPAPGAQVVVAGVLFAAFELGDLGEVPARQGGELAPGQAGVGAQFPQPRAERFAGLLHLPWHRRAGSGDPVLAVRNGHVPDGLERRLAQPHRWRVGSQFVAC
jgi:hypothetical protein